MEQITRLDLLQPDGYGINIRFATDLILDGEAIKSLNHRICIMPDTDIVAAINAVNQNFISLKRPPISDKSIASIAAFTDSHFTDELKARYAALPKESAE